jgi:hypothetical protein
MVVIFSCWSALNISYWVLVSFTLGGIESDTDVCVRVCVRVCVCVCVCVVHMYSLSVCVSQAALSASSSFISAVRSIYLSSSCYISSSYLS